jgi:hypothetical protein
LETTEEADFGDTPVYFDSRGIVNALSLYQLGQKFKVTYNSTNCGGVFKVFTKAGVIEFAPTVKGLHAINLCENPDTAYLLVNDTNLAFHSPVQTVRRNYEGFTKKQVQHATLACRIMGMIGAPSEREYQGLVRQKKLQDCPITPSDIANAHKILAPTWPTSEGKRFVASLNMSARRLSKSHSTSYRINNMLHFQRTSCLLMKSHSLSQLT